MRVLSGGRNFYLSFVSLASTSVGNRSSCFQLRGRARAFLCRTGAGQHHLHAVVGFDHLGGTILVGSCSPDACVVVTQPGHNGERGVLV